MSARNLMIAYVVLLSSPVLISSRNSTFDKTTQCGMQHDMEQVTLQHICSSLQCDKAAGPEGRNGACSN